MNAATITPRDKSLLAQARASARRKTAKGRGNPEQQLQKAIIDWWKVAYKGLGVPDEKLLYFSNMHGFGGGKQGAIMGKIRKDMGARPDIPDLFLAMPRRIKVTNKRFPGMPMHWQYVNYAGLYIETKDTGKKPTKDQLAFHKVLRGQGYMVKVRDNLDDAMELLTNYVKGAL